MFCNITNSVTDDGKVEMNFVGDQRFMIECIYQIIKMYFDDEKMAFHTILILRCNKVSR